MTRRPIVAAGAFLAALTISVLAIDMGQNAPLAHGLQGQNPTPTTTPTPEHFQPELVQVEIRPDRSLAIEWTHDPSATSYEIGFRANAGNYTVTALTSSPGANALTAYRVLKSGDEWPGVDGAAYEFAVRQTGLESWSTPAPVTVGQRGIEVTGSVLGGSAQVGWTQVGSGEPFYSYEILVGDGPGRCGLGALTPIRPMGFMTGSTVDGTNGPPMQQASRRCFLATAT